MKIERNGYTLYIIELDGRGRSAERRAVDTLVRTAFGNRELCHHQNGAPYIAGVESHISVSHGGGKAVLAVSVGPIGIDIEAPRPQLERVRDKFMRPEDDSASLLHAWTAKEATFKAAACDGLTIHDISLSADKAIVPDGRSFIIEYLPSDTALIAVATPQERAEVG
jgi:phosphopantetheinyl transferase (holo-ACP synthase)